MLFRATGHTISQCEKADKGCTGTCEPKSRRVKQVEVSSVLQKSGLPPIIHCSPLGSLGSEGGVTLPSPGEAHAPLRWKPTCPFPSYPWLRAVPKERETRPSFPVAGGGGGGTQHPPGKRRPVLSAKGHAAGLPSLTLCASVWFGKLFRASRQELDPPRRTWQGRAIGCLLPSSLPPVPAWLPCLPAAPLHAALCTFTLRCHPSTAGLYHMVSYLP